MGLHVPIPASKLEILASKCNRAFFWDTLYACMSQKVEYMIQKKEE